MASVTAPESISSLYLQEKCADVKFAIVQNGKTTKLLHAHRNILANESKVFYAMFFCSLPVKEMIVVNDTSYSEFEEFLQFFYFSNVDVNLTLLNTNGVAQLADRYGMMGYLNGCVELASESQSVSEILWGYQMSMTLKNQRFQKLFEHKIRQSPYETLQSAEFLDCSQETLRSILEMDGLQCNEFDIFLTCIAWAKKSCCRRGLNENNPRHLRNALGAKEALPDHDCFHLIRFRTMERKEIKKVLKNRLYVKMFKKHELEEVRSPVSIYAIVPTIFKRQPRCGPLLYMLNDTPVFFFISRGWPFRPYFLKAEDYILLQTNVDLVLGRIFFNDIFRRGLLKTKEEHTFNISIAENDEPQYPLCSISVTDNAEDGPRVSFVKNGVQMKADKVYRLTFYVENFVDPCPYYCFAGNRCVMRFRAKTFCSVGDVRVSILNDQLQVSADPSPMKLFRYMQFKRI